MKQQGFTLIEFLIYIGLVSILLTVMSQVFIATLTVRTESEGTTNVQQDGRFIVSRLSYDVHRAKALVTPVLGGSSSTFTLTITENGSDHTYQYSSSSGTLTLTIDTGTPVALNSPTTNLTAFSVQRIGNSATDLTARDTAKIHMILKGKGDIAVGTQEFQLDTTLGLR